MSRWHTTDFDFLPDRAFQARGWKSGMTLEGGGKAPAPDPAVGEAARMNAQLAKESFEFEKSTYQNYILPMLQKDLDMRGNLITDQRDIMRREMAIAEEQQKLYKDNYLPVEQRAIRDAENYDSNDNVNRRMGIAASGVNQQFSNARGQMNREMARYMAPNSSAFARENAKLAAQQALASAGAQTGAAFDTEDRAIALRAGVADRGRGVTGTIGNFLNQASATGSNAGNTSSQGVSTFTAGSGVMNRGTQTAMQGYSNQANILNQDYQNRLSAYNTKQSGTNALLGAVGTIGGMMVGGPMGAKMGGSIAGMMGRKDGGPVDGPGGPRDDQVPAMLSDGEFVLNEGAVKHFGLSRLEKMNKVGLENQRARGLRA